jgi:hybrid cluster-associated redox disulfide protein
MTVDIDDPDLPLAEIFRLSPRVAPVFWRHRMACVGCPIAPFHTVRDACIEYRLDEAAFRAALRAAAGSVVAPARPGGPASPAAKPALTP